MGDRGYLGISELGQCARRVFMTHRREFDEFIVEDRCSLRKMALGTLGEQIVADERGDVEGRQLEVKFGPALGHLDGYIPGDPPELWECKITTGASISKWRRGGLPRYYLWQVNAYMRALSDTLGVPVSSCRLDAMDRTSAEIHHLTIPFDPEQAQAALDRAVLLDRVIENGPIPDREYEADEPECRYCPFRAKCWEGTVELQAVETGPEIVDADHWDGFAEAIDLYATGRELKEEAVKMMESAQEEIIEGLREHKARGAMAGGFKAIYSQMSQERFETKAFRAAHPELWEKFKKAIDVNRLDVRALK
jgi:hypothetical protein